MANIYLDTVSGSITSEAVLTTGTLTSGGTVTFVPSTVTYTVPPTSGYTYYTNYLQYEPTRTTQDREQSLLAAECTIKCKAPLSIAGVELARILTSCGIPLMLNGEVSYGILNTVITNNEVFYTWTYTKETEVVEVVEEENS